jgi:hypothetical protein
VLRWHHVLFRALEKDGLRREEAASLTNAQAIERLPTEEQPAAWHALDAFCDGFNASFGLVENIYECTRNPFLYEDEAGVVRVYLSGSGGVTPVVMGPDVPVAFSLPSAVAGETDANGLATVQLCNRLSDVHNELLRQLQATSSDSMLPAAHARADTAQPTISYLTPHHVMKKQLLSFEPSAHLLPLLSAFRLDEEAEAARGASFELSQIERALIHTVFPHATPLAVVVHHFPYKGELQRTGRLGRLKQRVPQVGDGAARASPAPPPHSHVVCLSRGRSVCCPT